MTKKERIDKILKDSHLIINEATGTDISKTRKDEQGENQERSLES